MLAVERPVEEGRCALCGWSGVFETSRKARAPGSDYRCGQCEAARRYRDEAAAIVDAFGSDGESVADLVASPSFSSKSIYYVGISGPLRNALRGLPRYVESTLAEPSGSRFRPTRRSYQDLQDLGYAAGSFDLAFSSHVMEHVPDLDRAFTDIRRVLRPGGSYIFSVPFSSGRPTRTRAELHNGELTHLLEPHFHNSPQGDALVFTDFGTDVVATLERYGFAATVSRREPHLPRYLNAVITATLPKLQG